MYDRTYLTVKKLLNELHRLRYNHVDEPEIFEMTKEIIEKLKRLETILKTRIEGE